jgi:hypothetical protein
VASGVLVGEAVRRFGGGVVTPAGEYTMGVLHPSASSVSSAYFALLYSLFCIVRSAVSYLA